MRYNNYVESATGSTIHGMKGNTHFLDRSYRLLTSGDIVAKHLSIFYVCPFFK